MLAEHTPAHANLSEAVRAHMPIVVFGAVYFVGFVSFGLLTGRPSTLSYAFTMIVLFLALATVDRRVGLSRGSCGRWRCGGARTWPAA